MSDRQNEKLHHMDRDAYRLFSRGLFLMLTGVLMSVLALVFQPYLTSTGWLFVVLGGIGVAVALVFWPGGRPVEHAGEQGQQEAVGD